MKACWFKSIPRITLCLLLVLGLLQPPASGAGSATNRPIKDKWALIVGISEFQDPRHNLHYAAKDARDFRNYLVKEARFAPSHVKLLTDSDATRVNILEELGDRWLPRVVGPDDLVVLYISSHGSPPDADVVGVNYVIAHDTDLRSLYATGIATQEMIRMIRMRIKSDRIVVVLDACFSGAATDPDPTGAYKQRSLDVDEFVHGTNQLVICSSQPDETSAESSALNNGVFTHYLIEGLRQHGLDTKLADAFSYCREKVQEYAQRIHRTQTPVMKSKWEGSGLILAALPGDPRSSTDETPQVATTQPPAVAASPPPLVIASAVPPTSAVLMQSSTAQSDGAVSETPAANVQWGTNQKAGDKAEKAGQLGEAEQHFRQAVAVAEKFGNDDIRLAGSLNSLALLLNQTLRSKEAEQLANRALEIYQTALGPQHRYVASVLTNLGQIKETEGDLKSVERLYGQALAIMQEKLGPEDPHMANTLGRLAELDMKEGKYDDAERRMKRALQIKEKSYGLQSKPVAVQLNSLGLLAEARHRYEDADAKYKHALSIMEQVLPGNSTDLAVTMNNLGRVEATLGHYEKAESLIARAVEIQSEKRTSQYPISLYQLADVYTALGKFEQAQRMYQEALKVTQETFGYQHPVVAVILHSLGVMYYKQKRFAEAEDYLQRSLVLKERLYPPQHQEIAATCVALANAFRDDHKYDKADPLYREALAIYTKVLGPKSWDVYYTAKKYWKMLDNCSRTDDAARMKAMWTALEPQFAK